LFPGQTLFLGFLFFQPELKETNFFPGAPTCHQIITQVLQVPSSFHSHGLVEGIPEDAEGIQLTHRIAEISVYR
jgi:hypothetical protein